MEFFLKLFARYIRVGRHLSNRKSIYQGPRTNPAWSVGRAEVVMYGWSTG